MVGKKKNSKKEKKEAPSAISVPTAEHGVIELGTKVRIQGLVAAPQYNDMTGIVKSFQSDTGRYEVKLDSSNEKLGLKPERLVILSVCSYCKTNELRNTDCICPRCHLPAYCSAKCRKADWNDKHKATCVPKDLPEPPEPVGDANVGDERFERSRKYVDMATQAGRDGRFAEQIKLMEALVEKDPMQLAAYLQLYERLAKGMTTKRPFSI